MKELYKQKLIDEYETIKKMKFWKIYNFEIEEERKKASRHCETDKPEVIPSYQGTIRAFDFIKTLPQKILKAAGEIKTGGE